MFIPIYFILFIVSKILSQKRKLCLKEFIYFLLTCGLFLTYDIVYFVVLGGVIEEGVSVTRALIFEAAAGLFIFLWLWRGRAYSAKKAVILSLMSMLIMLVSDFPSRAIFLTFMSAGDWFFAELFLVLWIFAFNILAAVVFVRLSKSIRASITQSEKMQTALMGIVIFLYVSFFASLRYAETLGDEEFLGVIVIHAIFFVIYVVISLVSFVLFTKSLEARYALQRKEDEERDLQYYTDELEQKTNVCRKFKHDYDNILRSMDLYFQEKDWVGLEQYYQNQVKRASETITQESFSLANLDKIKVKEVKGTFIRKLMYAQSEGIDFTFEADKEIDDFYVSSVDLVRIIGILMDNAIEALTGLPGGKLLVGCFKEENGVTIIVQNTCRPDLPKLHELMQAGFSTKGEGRGLGLSILQELVDAHDNLTRKTNIVGDNFIQTIQIVAEGRGRQ